MIKHIASLALSLALALTASLAGAKPTHEPVAIDPVIAALGSCEAKTLIQAARPGESALVCDAHAPRIARANAVRIASYRVGRTTVEHIGR